MPDANGNPIPMVDVLPTQHEIPADYSHVLTLDRPTWFAQGHAVQFARDLDAAARLVAPEFGLPPEPTAEMVVAHAALSSGFGRSRMTQLAHNTFGIKAGRAWTGDVVRTPATEYDQPGDVPRKTFATWRYYPDWAALMRDYFRLIMTTKRYHASSLLLMAGDPDYMAQLGRDGWYTHTPAQVKAEWASILRWVQKVIADPGATVVPFDHAHPAPEGARGGGSERAGINWWAVAGLTALGAAAAWALSPGSPSDEESEA